MRKIYSYEADRWDFVEDANHSYIPWQKPPYELVFQNSTPYDLAITSQGPWVELKKGERKTIVSVHHFIAKFWVNTPNGKFWFEEEGGVIIGREVRQGFLQDDVVPVLNDGVIEFRHKPTKWTLKNRSITKVPNPAYQVKVRNWTPYDVIVYLDERIIDIIKSKCIQTIFLPKGNHMIHFDTKEEEYVCHDKARIYEDFLGTVNGCYMGILEDFFQNHMAPSWQVIIQKKRGYSGWCCIERIDRFSERMFFWGHAVGPGSIEPNINHLYTWYARETKTIELCVNRIDDRLD